MKTPKKRELQTLLPQFKLNKPLGSGGNAIVYEATRGPDRVAVKFLLNADPRRYGRFRDEVLVVTTALKDSNRIIPIIDYQLPDAPGTEIPWYSMPVAIPLRQHLKGASRREVEAAALLAWCRGVSSAEMSIPIIVDAAEEMGK